MPVHLGGKGELEQYIANLPKVRYVRLEKRGGEELPLNIEIQNNLIIQIKNNLIIQIMNNSTIR